ncbi:MAG: DUF3160 domain-containing protein [candidate division WOR-3 bacterium]
MGTLVQNGQRILLRLIKSSFLIAILIANAFGQNEESPIENMRLIQLLTPNQKTLLTKNGFLVTPSQFDQIYQIYQYAKKQNMPIYVTTDAILHTFHILFDYSLRVIETEYFNKLLLDLTQGLLDYELAQLQLTKSPKVTKALKRNIAYLAVAGSLFDDKFVPPKEGMPELVKAELELIERAKGMSPSPIFNYQEDYSQYKPRGHYTRNEKFARYFKVMMWYARIGFYLKPGNQELDIARGRDLTRQAILLVLAIKNGRAGKPPQSTWQIWEKIYQPLSFLIGKTDDLNYYDYNKLIVQLFPEKDIAKQIEKDAIIDQFIASAQKLPAPKILSTYYLKEDTIQTLAVVKGFRLLGSRFIPDSYIFQQLVYDKVGTMHLPRYLPKGLDVMAVLGSNRAREILKTVYQETRYLNYETQLLKLKNEFSELSRTEWNQSVYFATLYAIKLLLEPISGSSYLPNFLFTPAYADKTLMTACGFWAQLRHDTILYAKQSYTVALTAIRPEEKIPGYVEPKPLVYEQISETISDLIAILKQFGILPSEVNNRLESLKTLTQKLKAISDKEIKGIELDDDELRLIKNIGDNLEGMTTFPAQLFRGVGSEADTKMALIADVHTDPNTKQVLEVGVGKPFFIYAVIPFQHKQFLALGGVYSYYEFTKPLSERMTDEEWQKALSQEPKPDLPVWANSFIAE